MLTIVFLVPLKKTKGTPPCFIVSSIRPLSSTQKLGSWKGCNNTLWWKKKKKSLVLWKHGIKIVEISILFILHLMHRICTTHRVQMYSVHAGHMIASFCGVKTVPIPEIICTCEVTASSRTQQPTRITGCTITDSCCNI